MNDETTVNGQRVREDGSVDEPMPLTREEFQRVIDAFREAGFDIGFYDNYGAFVVDVLKVLEETGLTVRAATPVVPATDPQAFIPGYRIRYIELENAAAYLVSQGWAGGIGFDEAVKALAASPSPDTDRERLADIAVMALGEVTTGAAYGLYHKAFREHFVARLTRAEAYRPIATGLRPSPDTDAGLDVQTRADVLRRAVLEARAQRGRLAKVTADDYAHILAVLDSPELAARLTSEKGQPE